MHTALSARELHLIEERLQRRAQELCYEIDERNKRAADERFTRVASEVPDLEDASLADVVVDTTNAAIKRDADELREIEAALGRIAAGSYGVCLRCGSPIPLQRLQAVPTARYDERCQRLEEHERGLAWPPKL
jgi:RNA polymerase-binding transcription factor DksA